MTNPPKPRYRKVDGFDSVTLGVRHYYALGRKVSEIAAVLNTTPETVRGILQRDRTANRKRMALTWPQREKIRRTYIAYLDLMAEAFGSDRDAIHTIARYVHVNKEPARVEQKGGEDERSGATVLPDNPKPAVTIRAAEISVSPHADEPSPADSSQTGEGVFTSKGWKLPTKADPTPERAEVPAEPQTPASAKISHEDAVITTLPLKKAIDTLGTAMVTLRAPSGEWLGLDGTTLTRDKAYRYRGKPEQARAMRRTNPLAKNFHIEPHGDVKR